jgi:hypothetical protein
LRDFVQAGANEVFEDVHGVIMVSNWSTIRGKTV